MKLPLHGTFFIMALCLAGCAKSQPFAAAKSPAGGVAHQARNFFRERLDEIREELSKAYRDVSRPTAERTLAFDTLLETFDKGTPETVLEKYIKPPSGEFFMLNSEVEGGAGLHTMALTAPDGTGRWLHFNEDIEHGVEATVSD